MTTIYLTGQSDFGNRGCEALVRSTVMLLNEHLNRPRILVPSTDIARDAAQWPLAAQSGVEFVPYPKVPYRHLTWTRLCRLIPALTYVRWPMLPLRHPLSEHLANADAVLSIGGDILSLDYALFSPFFYISIAENALRLGKPVLLWGASIGPFSAKPGIERQMASHLKRLSLITVRESHTLAYLSQLGISENVLPVADSAFVMRPEPLDTAPFWPIGDSVLGLNISPVVEKARLVSGASTTLREEVAAFVRNVLETTNLGILFIPHVAPLDGSAHNNDEQYLAELAASIGDTGGRLRCVPSGCNAPQLKYIISRCRQFIGARTHATIAAFSTGVPTISIAYSVKARGINRALFGHERYVLPTPEVSASTLNTSLALLQEEEATIRTVLDQRVPVCRIEAEAGARWLAMHLESNCRKGA